MSDRSKRNIQILVIASMLCFMGPLAAAQKSEEENRLKSLRSIKAVRVQVTDFAADFKAEFKKAGLTEGLLETMTERGLEDAGIKVLQEFEPDASNQTGLLVLTVQAHSPISARKFTMTGEGIDFSAPGGQPAYLFLIKIELRQKVTLARESSVDFTATTWSADSFGIRRLNRLSQVINEQVDQFVKAYRSENQLN